jgi:hypothetical protein
MQTTAVSPIRKTGPAPIYWQSFFRYQEVKRFTENQGVVADRNDEIRRFHNEGENENETLIGGRGQVLTITFVIRRRATS